MSVRRFAALCLLLACAPACAARAAGSVDPRTIPLVDQRGTPFRLADLRGHPTFVTFVASRCTDACPIANAEFALLAQRFSRGRSAQLVTITLDPEYDTPFVMASIASHFRASPRVWRFASGRSGDVRRLMRSFGIITQSGRSGVPEVHSTFVFLLDPRVRVARTLLLSTAFVHDALAALARPPIREAPRRTSAN